VSVPPTVDLVMRGGDNPVKELNDIEKRVAEVAWQRFISNPVFTKKGLQWSYNWTHFNTFWMAKDRKVIDLLYRYEPYPQYIEVEITTACNLRCRICEHTYWDESIHLSLRGISNDYKQVF